MTTQRDQLAALATALKMAAGQVSMATILGQKMRYDPIDAVLRARVLPLVEAAREVLEDPRVYLHRPYCAIGMGHPCTCHAARLSAALHALTGEEAKL